MSTRYGGPCGLLVLLAIIVAASLLISWILPGNTLAAFTIIVILLVVLAPMVFGGSGGRSFRIVRRGGYAVDAVEVDTPQAAYRAVDPSKMTRGVIDSTTMREHIISGAPTDSFRTACLNAWDFDQINKKKGWIVVDEKGNDITDLDLSRYHGIATIKSLIPTDRYEPSKDTIDTQDSKDEYSDMDRGVKFYD